MSSSPVIYYELVPGHGEPIDRLQYGAILLDGDGSIRVGSAECRIVKARLQIFAATVIGVLPGSLPIWRNSRQRCASGLYAEQISRSQLPRLALAISGAGCNGRDAVRAATGLAASAH